LLKKLNYLITYNSAYVIFKYKKKLSGKGKGKGKGKE